MSPGRASREGGFSLIEAVVAIAIIASALIISGAFLNTLASSSARLRAQTEMLRELETSMEMIRSRFLPLLSGVTVPAGSNESYPDLVVTAVVEEREIPGLYRVMVRAECTVGRSRLTRTLTSQVWEGP